MSTTEIKRTMQQLRIPYWRLADELGVSENTVGRWLRHQLGHEKEIKIMAALDKLTRKAGDRNG